MKILLTGVTGYIGKRLLPLLIEDGNEVFCLVRDLLRVDDIHKDDQNVSFIQGDLLDPESLTNLPDDIDVAYYLVHSMSQTSKDFQSLEEKTAENFKTYLQTTKCKQLIYLSGISNDQSLSKHLLSRKKVEDVLQSDQYALTVFRAGIIVGSGSSSFEIIRDLVEKLPVMVAPKWLDTKTQPLAVRDVLSFLNSAKGEVQVYNKTFDIFGPEILTYKKMILEFAKIRGLNRRIITVPVMTPRLSSYWLYFVTSTSYKLARNLVDSLGVEIVGKPSDINSILHVNPISYTEAVKLAFEKIEQNSIVSSWKDSFISSNRLKHKLHKYVNVPKYGCFKDYKERQVQDQEETLNKIWSIGGVKGWYYGNPLWKLRGYLDKMVGGIGLRRGRTHPTSLHAGDSLDFWRVIFADKDKKNYCYMQK